MSKYKFEQQHRRTRRKEIMKELEELNQGDKVFDIVTANQNHEEMINKIEGRVAGFFKKGEFDQNAFDYYLYELGDLTKVDKFLGSRTLSVYDDTGLKKNDFQYKVTNIYVEYAMNLAKKIRAEFRDRVGVKPELGHWQRVIRNGMKELEDKIGTGDRKRILQLFPHLLYENKMDIEQVAEVWGLKRAGAVRQMQKLTDKENGQVIIESKSGRKKVYSFNPKYTFSGAGGKKKDFEVKVYVDFLQNVIKSVEEIEAKLAKELAVKELTHSALSTLHAIIPYFHYQTFYAVLNPTEPITIGEETVWEAKLRELETGEESNLVYLSKRQLSYIVAKSKTDRNYINRDLYVLAQAEAIIYTANTILINPKLMFCMGDEFNTENDEYVKSVLILFKDQAVARKQQKGIDINKMIMVKKKSNKKTRNEE